MRYLFALLLLISGCASQTRLAVDNLDERHPVRSSEVCQHATQLASLHDDIKLSRTLGSPAIVVAVGVCVCKLEGVVPVDVDASQRDELVLVAQCRQFVLEGSDRLVVQVLLPVEGR